MIMFGLGSQTFRMQAECEGLDVVPRQNFLRAQNGRNHRARKQFCRRLSTGYRGLRWLLITIESAPREPMSFPKRLERCQFIADTASVASKSAAAASIKRPNELLVGQCGPTSAPSLPSHAAETSPGRLAWRTSAPRARPRSRVAPAAAARR